MAVSRRSLLTLLPLAGAALPVAACRGTARPRAAGLPRIEGRRRARALGVRIGVLPTGPFNAITDVAGVRVGHATLVRGDGPLVVGEGPVRTGVTAIWPRDDVFETYLPCGADAPNGNGELTGLLQASGLGFLGSPICLTGTSSVGAVYDALVGRCREALPDDAEPRLEPIVGETWDGELHDVAGRHVSAGDVGAALDGARGGPVAEGGVGGGTGMICYGFKGGIGTASRQTPRYTVGALVQANHGARRRLRIDGVPVGEEIADLVPGAAGPMAVASSILIVLATDAPLLPHQLARLARRAVHGLAKTGSISSNSSGDFALAFSTANPVARRDFWTGDGYELGSVEQFDIQPLFEGAAEAVEEAIVNALFMADDMIGRDGVKAWALPLERALESLERHGRLFEPERGTPDDA